MAGTDGAITDWREALSAVMDAAAASYRELPERLAAAEAFLRRHIAELETRQHPPSEAELDRVAQYLERVQNFGLYRRCPVNTPKLCVRPEGHGGWHISNSGTTWPDRPDPSFVAGETAAHRAGLTGDQENIRAEDYVGPKAARPRFDGLFSTGGYGQPAPTHLSEGRLAQDGEAVCARPKYGVDLIAGPVTDCAREKWHTGPHMDATAIAHAGKAGEVWG